MPCNGWVTSEATCKFSLDFTRASWRKFFGGIFSDFAGNFYGVMFSPVFTEKNRENAGKDR
jgi:hypothetical protein